MKRNNKELLKRDSSIYIISGFQILDCRIIDYHYNILYCALCNEIRQSFNIDEIKWFADKSDAYLHLIDEVNIHKLVIDNNFKCDLMIELRRLFEEIAKYKAYSKEEKAANLVDQAFLDENIINPFIKTFDLLVFMYCSYDIQKAFTNAKDVLLTTLKALLKLDDYTIGSRMQGFYEFVYTGQQKEEHKRKNLFNEIIELAYAIEGTYA